MKLSRFFALPTFLWLLLACSQNTPVASTAAPSTQTHVNTPPETTTVVITSDTADIIFINGDIVTMDDSSPRAQAIAVLGDKIIAVGNNEEALKHRDNNTTIIDLQDRTLTPGFIDSHQHRIGDREMGGYTDADSVIQSAIEQGWTSINELFVHEPRLDELRALDNEGRLRLRVNAYLPLASPQGDSYGDWYKAYQPKFEYSPYLRLIGVKFFMDHGWGHGEVMWTQEQLDQMVMDAHRLGWQVAVHTLGEPAHTMILNAIEKSLSGAATDPYRDRIEHVIFISDEDMQRMKRLGILASIQLNGPGTWVDASDFAGGVTPDMYPYFARWRDLSDAGLIMLGSSDWPYGTLEPGFGSPMLLLYQAVTRTGTNRRPPDAWMVGQELTMEQALRLLTINGAYGTFEEDKKGSLQPGKLADMVILSDNPLTVPIESVPDIQILMTMIGGKMEYCAAGSETLCPLASSSPPIVATVTSASTSHVTASASLPDQPPANALDGSVDTAWNSGKDPEQWIQLNLSQMRAITSIRLTTAQYPEGETIHQIWGGETESNLQLLHEFKGFTTEFQVLEFTPPVPIENIRFLRVVTTQSPSWVAWREIEVTSP